MAKGPKPAELTLSEEEQIRLEAFVHRHNTPQQLAKRGHMVLLATQGVTYGKSDYRCNHVTGRVYE